MVTEDKAQRESNTNTAIIMIFKLHVTNRINNDTSYLHIIRQSIYVKHRIKSSVDFRTVLKLI